MNRVTRRNFLAVAGAAALSGCSAVGSRAGGSPTDGGGFSEVPGTPTDADDATTRTPSGESGSGDASLPVSDGSLSIPMSPGTLRERAQSGGPGKDGIPSIDEPKFVAPSNADRWLDDEDVVFGLVRNGAVKAYPQRILAQHEIVNDVAGDEPIAATYCPLTGTAIGFERGATTFGVSGRLVNNNLIMYDRRTERWWPQVLATSIPSPWSPGYARQTLRDFRLVWTTWSRWRAAHPDTEVLGRDTGHLRNYGNDPYGTYVPERRGYYRPDAGPMFAPLSADDRYEPKRVVVGARTADGAVAFLKDGLREAGILEGSLAGTPHLAVYEPALDTAYVYRNPDGAAFEYEGGTVVDGSGTEHDPDALPLDRVLAFDAMWFAWAGFYPETSVHE